MRHIDSEEHQEMLNMLEESNKIQLLRSEAKASTFCDFFYYSMLSNLKPFSAAPVENTLHSKKTLFTLIVSPLDI
jgi:hypothetical protein